MRKILMSVAAIVLAGGGLVACGSSNSSYGYSSDGNQYDYDGLCRDTRSNVRVDDDYCEDHRFGYAPVYLRHGQRVPRIGQTFTSNSFIDKKPSKKKPKVVKPKSNSKVKPPKSDSKKKLSLSKPKSHSNSGSRSSGRSGGGRR